MVNVLNKKIALQSISAKGITADHMKRSAEFVAEELSKVGVNAQVVQSQHATGTPGAWGVDWFEDCAMSEAPTVLLYAHHDVQPVPDALPAHGTPTPVRRHCNRHPPYTGAARPTMAAASPSVGAARHCRPSATI